MSDDKENESGNGETPTWERKLVHELALSALAEQRRARRWGIFFKFLAFAYLILLLVLWMPDELGLGTVKAPGEHTAVVEVQGVIAPGAKASADRVIAGLRKAFEDKRTKGVIVRINSPGGSPVQAGYIHDEILRLRKKHQEIPLHAVVTDICASGGYYIAAAADKIYVDKASVVGSIGVLMNGFGFVDAMETLGIERRLLTAGEHKGIMDPFSPVEPQERAHLQTLIDNIHQQFIQVVREGRGARLKEDPMIFSGLFWTGEESIELGLADALGSSSQVAREVIGAEDLVDFTQEEDLLDRFAKRLGAGAASALAEIGGLDASPRLR